MIDGLEAIAYSKAMINVAEAIYRLGLLYFMFWIFRILIPAACGILNERKFEDLTDRIIRLELLNKKSSVKK